MLIFGIGFGGHEWIASARLGVPTPAGTVMLAALPILMGLQLVLAFVGYDIASVPQRPIHRRRAPYVVKNSGKEMRRSLIVKGVALVRSLHDQEAESPEGWIASSPRRTRSVFRPNKSTA